MTMEVKKVNTVFLQKLTHFFAFSISGHWRCDNFVKPSNVFSIVSSYGTESYVKTYKQGVKFKNIDLIET